MEDHIIRATAAGATVRAFAALTTNLVEEARRIHQLPPVAAAALGRTLTAGAMMSRTLKGERHVLTIQLRGNGPMEGLVVVSDSASRVRGYVYNPLAEVPLNREGKLDVSAAIGKDGYLNVVKDLGLKEPYIGFVKLVSGEIGEDIAYYYAYSEQIPTVVSLGVLVDKDESVLAAGGFIIQLMPDAPEEIITYLEEKISTLPPISKMLSGGLGPEEILEQILGGKELVIEEKLECSYECNCSRERMERNIFSLGSKEILDMIHEQNGAEAQCHFCNEKYYFTAEELMALVDEMEDKKEGV